MNKLPRQQCGKKAAKASKRGPPWRLGSWVSFAFCVRFLTEIICELSNLEFEETNTYPRRRPNHRRDVWLQRAWNRDFLQKAGSDKSVSLTQKTRWIDGRCFGHERGSYAKPTDLKYTTRPTTQTAELASVSHFIASENSYPDDSFSESCNMPISFCHFEVKIDVVRVMHVKEVA